MLDPVTVGDIEATAEREQNLTKALEDVGIRVPVARIVKALTDGGFPPPNRVRVEITAGDVPRLLISVPFLPSPESLGRSDTEDPDRK